MRRAFLAPVLDLSLPIESAEARPLGRGLRAAMRALAGLPSRRAEVALCGAVTSALLGAGEEDALRLLAERAGEGQVGFSSTACFGAFLPLLPDREASRQLDLGDQINRDALGDRVYRPAGLFPPQLGWDRRIADLALRRGLSRVVADDLAYAGENGGPPRDRHFPLLGAPGLSIFFADRALGRALESGALRDLRSLRRALAPKESGYGVLRIPGRLLHEGQPGLALLESLGGGEVVAASFEELLGLFPEFEPVEPRPCALGTEPADLDYGVPFARWSSPDNDLHALLWRLARLTSSESRRLERIVRSRSAAPGRLRALLDRSLDGAAWRFASGRPDLDLDRVERGGRGLLTALRSGEDSVRPATLVEAELTFARLRECCAHLVGLSGAGAR